MTMKAKSSLSHRNQLRTMMGDVDWRRNEVDAADAFIDDALNQVQHEEPSFESFIEDDPMVDYILNGSTWAAQTQLTRALKRGEDVPAAMSAVYRLMYRASAAIAYEAVQRERSKS